MSGENDIKRDDPMIAAEYALGLLEGEELLAARGKLATDPEFARRKEWWDGWFAPLTDDVAGAEPGEAVWSRIEARVAALRGDDQGSARVIALESRLRRWQWATGFASAAALLLALFVTAPGFGPVPAPPAGQPPVLAATDPLVAQVPIGDTGLRIDVTYVPESEQMLIGAIGLTADGVHDHELWLVPGEGEALQSLGVVAPGEVLAMELPEEIVRNIADGSALVLTREPIGGKPVGAEAGPVVAEGTFSQV
ncbi:anti-sigma factor domain-containing protein [Qipengyuania nanhaisediminis]|uniref:anti-sigma factor n=1 Tax=Qipengyuania nanhaisediminis TaxID=604088 RepID=UPI0038B3474D